MPSYKKGRLTEDLLRELSALLRELKDPRISSMLSIVRVELSGDQSHCKIYVSSLAGQEDALRAVEGLESASGFLRRELFRRIQLRKSPALHFIADDSIAYAADINRKLHDLQCGTPSGEEDETE